jgi:hypothetical protein
MPIFGRIFPTRSASRVPPITPGRQAILDALRRRAKTQRKRKLEAIKRSHEFLKSQREATKQPQPKPLDKEGDDKTRPRARLTIRARVPITVHDSAKVFLRELLRKGLARSIALVPTSNADGVIECGTPTGKKRIGTFAVRVDRRIPYPSIRLHVKESQLRTPILHIEIQRPHTESTLRAPQHQHLGDLFYRHDRFLSSWPTLRNTLNSFNSSQYFRDAEGISRKGKRTVRKR